MKTSRTPLILILLLFSGSLTAHDLWVEDHNGTMVLHYGHRFEQNDGPGSIKYDPVDVKSVSCVKNGQITAAKTEITEGVISVKTNISAFCDTLIFRIGPIQYTKTVHGTFRKKKSETEYPLKSWISIESVKRIITSKNIKSDQPVTQELEITPTANLSAVTPGSKITFRVTRNGKTVSDAAVSINGEVRGVTDKNGLINLRIRNYGDQIIQVSKAMPAPGSDADETIESASLHFVIEQNKK
jgi:nickel transport protein